MEKQTEIASVIEEKNKYQKRCHEVEDENFELKLFISNEAMRNEKFKNALIDVFKELDTVGFLHGAGSKEIAKNKLVEAMKTRYGEKFWNMVIVKEEPKPAVE